MNKAALAFFIIGCLIVLAALLCWLLLHVYFKKQLKVYETWKDELMAGIKKWDWLGSTWITRLLDLNDDPVNKDWLKTYSKQIYDLNSDGYFLLNAFRDAIYSVDFGKVSHYKKQLKNVFSYLNKIQSELEIIVKNGLENLSLNKTQINYWQLNNDLNQIEDYNIRFAKLLNKKPDLDEYDALKNAISKNKYDDQYVDVLNGVLNSYIKKMTLWHYLWLANQLKKIYSQANHLQDMDLNIKLNLIRNKLENLKGYDFNYKELSDLINQTNKIASYVINNKFHSEFIDLNIKIISNLKTLKAEFVNYLQTFMNQNTNFDEDKAWHFKLDKIQTLFRNQTNILQDTLAFSKMIDDFNLRINDLHNQKIQQELDDITKQNFISLIELVETKNPDSEKLNHWKKGNNKLDKMKKYSAEMSAWLIADYKLFIYRNLAELALRQFRKNSEEYARILEWLDRKQYLQIFRFLGWK